MLRRSFSRPDMGSYYRPGLVARTGGSYDLAGIWRPVNYGPHTFHFDDRAYHPNLHALHYKLEDDYYGAYGDLLEFEATLRMNRHLSEEERLRRWRMRLAFEELEEAQRLRRYRSMAEADRMLLGLTHHSWWGERYTTQPFHHPQNWRSRFGNQMRRWDSSYLPLSSTLASRFAPVWGGSIDHLNRNGRHLNPQLQQVQNQIHMNRLEDAERRLDHKILHREIDNVGKRLADQETYIRDSLENTILRNQERSLESRLHNEERSLENHLRNEERGLEMRLRNATIYDQESQYNERQVLQDVESSVKRRNNEILYQQERILENQLENQAFDRPEQRLNDATHYIPRSELLDSDLRDPLGYDYDIYQDSVERDVLADEIRNDYEGQRFERDEMLADQVRNDYERERFEQQVRNNYESERLEQEDILADEIRNDYESERFEQDNIFEDEIRNDYEGTRYEQDDILADQVRNDYERELYERDNMLADEVNNDYEGARYEQDNILADEIRNDYERERFDQDDILADEINNDYEGARYEQDNY